MYALWRMPTIMELSIFLKKYPHLPETLWAKTRFHIINDPHNREFHWTARWNKITSKFEFTPYSVSVKLDCIFVIIINNKLCWTKIFRGKSYIQTLEKLKEIEDHALSYKFITPRAKECNE